jgi:hypothetical protein
MLKRVEIGGFIEIPEGAELPELDQIVTVSELRVQVTGKHEDKQKRRGDTSELVFTRKTTLLDGASILKVEEPPEPLFEGDEGGGDE